MPFLFCLPGPAAQRAQDGSPIRRAKNARRRAAPPSPRLPRLPLRPPLPPRHENSPVSRTPHAAHHRPACRAAAKKSGQPHAAPCRRPTADRQSARRMAATPRPAPAAKILLLAAAPRPIAPPAAPKFGPTARPRHAAGRPRAAKARAVWQPRRAPPRHENSPVSRTPHAAHHRPARHISAHNPANRAKIGQHLTGRTAPAPPQKQSGSSAPPSQSARPRPYGRGGVSVCPFRSFHPSGSAARSWPAAPPAPVQSAASSSALGS